MDTVYKYLWILTNVEKEASFTEISTIEYRFSPYTAARAQLEPSQTHWAVLKIHNNCEESINWVLIEQNESSLEVVILSGNQIEYQSKSGQLVKKSEEQIAEGRTWEARVQIDLEAGQSKTIYFRSYHDFHMPRPFDFKLMSQMDYDAHIDQRNLIQSLLIGGLGILLLYHFFLFLVNHQKVHAYFCIYILLQSIHFLYFYGLSREWFLAQSPHIDLGLSALPILIPSALMWANYYWIGDQPKRSKQWKKLKIFSLISILLFALSLILIYSHSAAIIGFRIVSLFIMLNAVFFFYFFRPFYKNAALDLRIFLAGTLLFSGLVSAASVLFYFEESHAGYLAQGATLLYILFFAIALGYRQMQTANEKEHTQQQLLQEFKLKQAFEEELKSHFEAKVLERTTALEEQKNILLKAKKQAEILTQQKSNLLSMVQHNIRIPLHGILGMSNLLQKSKNEDEQSQMLNSLHIASTNLLNLVNNILDYSQIESADIKLEQGPFVMQQMVDQLLDLILPMAKQKELGLILEYDQNLPYEFYGCESRLKQILANLLHNATKFTQEGHITFSVQLQTQTQNQALVKFSIEDTGPGIALEEQKRIFEGLREVQSQENHTHGRGGLGLAIVASLLKRLGSQIQLQSELGVGSVFSFNIWLDLSTKGNNESIPTLHNKQILLVEDNEINQAVASRFLQQWGIKVVLAQNGVEALLKVESHDFDLILMDLEMPVMDGYEATAILSKHEKFEIRSIPIVALSASVSSRARQKAIELGIEGFIAKPFNPKDLKQKIEAKLID